MPILTILGLVVSIVKLALQVAEWVKAHPEITDDVRHAMGSVTAALEHANGHLDMAAQWARQGTEAP